MADDFLAEDFFAEAFFAEDFFAAVLRPLDRLLEDFLLAVRLPVERPLDDFLLADFLELDFFVAIQTFSPIQDCAPVEHIVRDTFQKARRFVWVAPTFVIIFASSN